MVGWCRNVMSKMRWQSNRRRQQTHSGQVSPEEARVSEMQTHLSDIGSIRDLQAHRAEAKARETKAKQKAKVTAEDEDTKGF